MTTAHWNGDQGLIESKKLAPYAAIMEHVPEGGNWRDLPATIAAEAMGGAYESSGGRVGYWRRLNGAIPAPTITGSPIQKSTLLWHPTENRPISIEEAAALQSYPTIHTRTETTMSAKPTAHIKALDLFAGTGWGVACQRLGIKEAGVEIMPEAVATREANGMETIYRDVWDGLTLTAEQHREQYGSYGLLIASPPCQTFSLAGKGAGRAALDEVLEAIELHAYKDADALKAFGAAHDMRTALVLSPLAYVWRDRPRLVAMEQVPTVLPVWEACAEVMREWGYDVKVEALNAEQYGVPQTRKRAILVARRGGEVHMPKPTHSRYYSRTPEKLDVGVQKWVSMAEALGWGDSSKTICHGVQPHSARRPMTEPAATIAFGHDSASVGFVSAEVGDHLAVRAAKRDGGFDPVSVEQAAILQSYPGMLRSNYGSGGDASNRGEQTVNQPAPTLTSKADRNKWDGERNVTIDEAAALQSYPTPLRPEIEAWKWKDMPATTIIGDPRITAREHHFHGEQAKTALRLTRDEAVVLQTYEKPFIWCGNKGKQFLQIGNAVPPLLAEHVLAALIGITEGR